MTAEDPMLIICDDMDDCVGDCRRSVGLQWSSGMSCTTMDVLIPEGERQRRKPTSGALGLRRRCSRDNDAERICDDIDDRVARSTLAESATVQAKPMSADVLTFQKGDWMTMATSLTNAASVAEQESSKAPKL